MGYSGEKKVRLFTEFGNGEVLAENIYLASQVWKYVCKRLAGILPGGCDGYPNFWVVAENSRQFGPGVSRSPDDSNINHGMCSPG
jgi:hypothetical protein